jgi:hypothetical protein
LQKFLFIQIIVLICVEDSEETLAQQAWQLAVIEHGDLIDAFKSVVTALLKILEDVLEVGHTDSGFKFFCLDRLYK